LGHDKSAYEVLGVPQGASRDAVKAAFREHAKLCHPDRNPSPEAAAKWVQVQNATESLLHGKPYRVNASGRAARSTPPTEWDLRFDNLVRSKRFPLYFSTVCLVGGCVLFGGALYQQWYHPMYNAHLFIPAQHVETNKELNDQQRLMNDMLSRKLEERRSSNNKQQA